jgi:hypothetical protein
MCTQALEMGNKKQQRMSFWKWNIHDLVREVELGKFPEVKALTMDEGIITDAIKI